MRALTLSCFHSLKVISTQTFRRVRTAPVDRCVEIRTAPFSKLCQNWLRHVTNSGRVWRKVLECVSGILQCQSKSLCFNNEVIEMVTGAGGGEDRNGDCWVWKTERFDCRVGKTETVTAGRGRQKGVTAGKDGCTRKWSQGGGLKPCVCVCMCVYVCVY